MDINLNRVCDPGLLEQLVTTRRMVVERIAALQEVAISLDRILAGQDKADGGADQRLVVTQRREFAYQLKPTKNRPGKRDQKQVVSKPAVAATPPAQGNGKVAIASLLREYIQQNRKKFETGLSAYEVREGMKEAFPAHVAKIKSGIHVNLKFLVDKGELTWSKLGSLKIYRLIDGSVKQRRERSSSVNEQSRSMLEEIHKDIEAAKPKE